ncbi:MULTISPECIES: Imm53 family immunity protein [Burkholderia]|jgi:hypothetical protein|uniref:Imm53 family immunity protein n=1 Tax=Burkholderia TaxID=32008 RepID=UPI00110F1DEA|nr:hypothetical protein FFI87_027615 [Burkholderia sp. KBS0801]
MSGLIIELQRWYMFQCDEVWEHSYGVEIVNVDNLPVSLRYIQDSAQHETIQPNESMSS